MKNTIRLQELDLLQDNRGAAPERNVSGQVKLKEAFGLAGPFRVDHNSVSMQRLMLPSTPHGEWRGSNLVYMHQLHSAQRSRICFCKS